MLENIWLIPAVTAASFFLILFFGKKEPNKGATIGILALGLAFAFSSIAVGELISRPAARTGDVGLSIFQSFVIPFEVISVLLLAALVGAVVIARRD